MKHFFLAVILGFYLMVSLEDMSMAVDIPAPSFDQPDVSTPTTPGSVPEKKFDKDTKDKNLLTCASTALSGKFPFDMFGVLKSDTGTAATACPRITFFEGTPAPVSLEMCFVLNTIALLKYPLLIGLAISTIIAL